MKPAIQQPEIGPYASNPSPKLGAPSSPCEGGSLPRCSHRTAIGRQCRSQANDTRSGLCLLHSAKVNARRAHPSVSSQLLGPLTEFKSASEVNDFLSRLLLLLAKDRISPRRGAVMAYTSSLLLRSLRAMDLEALADEKLQGAPEILIDVVRPRRDPVSDTTGTPVKPS